MNRPSAVFAAAAGLLFAVACGSDNKTPSVDAPHPKKDAASKPSTEPEPAGMPGLQRMGDELILQTDQFTVEPGQEKYMCWTTKVSDAFKVTSFSKRAQSFVHHLVLGATTKEEPEGIRECDAAFSFTWRPLFAAGAGNVEQAFPSGVVQSVSSGTQLVVQLHLVNTADHPATDSARLVMTTTEDTQTQNVQFSAMGNTDIVLPPGQAGTVVTDCQSPVATRAVGFFPHMHLLGTSMTLEVGPSADDMHVAYQRDPYDFNDQRIDSVDMDLDGGMHTRLTCNFTNTTQKTVTYGESSFNEMCFLIMFLVGPPVGCIHGSAALLGSGDSAGAGSMGAAGKGADAAGCPDLGVMGVTLPGCCTQGMCGIDASQFSSGAGCVELSVAAAGAAQMGQAINFPAPRACGSGN